MKVEQRSINSEITMIGSDEKRTISGYAVKWNEWSNLIRKESFEFVERFSPGAFDESLRSGNPIKAFWNHNTDKVIGSTKSGTMRVESDNVGLRFEIDLPNNSTGNDIIESVRRGDVDGVSFGFKIADRKKDNTWDDSDYRNVKRTINRAMLKEISPTPFPAYPQTELSLRSAEEAYNDYKDSKDKPPESDWRIDNLRAKTDFLKWKHKLSD